MPRECQSLEWHVLFRMPKSMSRQKPSPAAGGGISREFSSIPATRRRYPDNEQKNRRRAVCAEKWPEAQAEQVVGLHAFSSQEGAETSPRGGVGFFCSRSSAGS